MDNATFPVGGLPLAWRTFVVRRWLWIAPTFVCGAMAAAAAWLTPREWKASQALLVRQETVQAAGIRPGKFSDLYEMKTLQETILELAKSRQVVAATLAAVRAAEGQASAAPPSDAAIDKFRRSMEMLPPYGAEFGKTEVFYFVVNDRRRDRAVALVSELCQQLDGWLRRLRAERAAGLVAELQQKLAIAQEDHRRQTNRLQKFEVNVGPDLGELRMLQFGTSGQSDLRQEVVQLAGEVRTFQSQVRETTQLLELLRAAQTNPQQLVAMPNRLLESQPALRRLKEGLVDAQLKAAQLNGVRSNEHPLVVAAVAAEETIRRDLHRELAAAVAAAEVDLDVLRQRHETAAQKLDGLNQRLDRVAEQRTEYAERVAAVDMTRRSLDQVRQNLGAAQAGEAAAQVSSLVTRIDQPETGPRPEGPSRATIALVGAIGGFLLGVAAIVLTSGSPEDPRLAAMEQWAEQTIRRWGPADAMLRAADASVEAAPASRPAPLAEVGADSTSAPASACDESSSQAETSLSATAEADPSPQVKVAAASPSSPVDQPQAWWEIVAHERNESAPQPEPTTPVADEPLVGTTESNESADDALNNDAGPDAATDGAACWELVGEEAPGECVAASASVFPAAGSIDEEASAESSEEAAPAGEGFPAHDFTPTVILDETKLEFQRNDPSPDSLATEDFFPAQLPEAAAGLPEAYDRLPHVAGCEEFAGLTLEEALAAATGLSS